MSFLAENHVNFGFILCECSVLIIVILADLFRDMFLIIVYEWINYGYSFVDFTGIVVTTTANKRSRLNCAIGAKARRGTQGKAALQRNPRL